jgi:hypothetical protein
MNRFWLSQGAHTAWDSSAETPHTSLEILLITGRDILRPYEIGIGAYSKVNIKYFNPLTYDSITKIALF